LAEVKVGMGQGGRRERRNEKKIEKRLTRSVGDVREVGVLWWP
jgi:hypothetical protein